MLRRGVARFVRRSWVRRIFWGATITFAVVAVAIAGLWWRLSSGPIELEMATIDCIAKCLPDLVETVEQTAAAFPGGAAQSLAQVGS